MVDSKIASKSDNCIQDLSRLKVLIFFSFYLTLSPDLCFSETAVSRQDIAISPYFRLADLDNPRKGRLLSPTDGDSKSGNFRFCNGEIGLVRLSDLVNVRTDCDDDPISPWSLAQKVEVGTKVYYVDPQTNLLVEVGAVTEVAAEDGKPNQNDLRLGFSIEMEEMVEGLEITGEPNFDDMLQAGVSENLDGSVFIYLNRPEMN